jgi:hypothetical protein
MVRGAASILTEQRAGRDEPIGFFLHVANPRPTFLDKGKTIADLPVEVAEAVAAAIRSVTAIWCKQRKAEERHASAAERRMDAMTRDKPITIIDAAFSVMAAAYMKASDNNTLPANARQVFYAARPDVLRLTGRDKLDDGDFIQRVLVDYMNEHKNECADWDIVFDDRGHLSEPHTGVEIGLGTLAVRDYLNGYAGPELVEGGFAAPKIVTHGPEERYGGLFYIEKEGFDELVDQVQIAKRFDLAFMSCKGMSVTAARELVDQTCARFGLTLFILRDFDVSGFSIASTLHQSNRRYEFSTKSGEDFKVVDLGLRLEDVERLGLQFEPVSFGKIGKDAIRNRLEINGATEREIDFLLTGPPGFGQRVELNAMTSRQFVDLIEGKLAEHRVRKVVPVVGDLEDAYRLFRRGAAMKRVVEEAIAAMSTEEIAAPGDLARRLDAYLAKRPASSWDAAIEALVAGDFA